MRLDLYRRALGASFETLPPAVRALHNLTEPETLWRGRCDVTRGPSCVTRALATLFRLPPEGRDQPLDVHFASLVQCERWERNFSGRRFVSRQYFGAPHILETVGPVTLLLRPAASPAGLSLTMNGARFFGVPLPRLLVPTIQTLEFERDGRYHFEVAASLPLFGLLVRYAGWLEQIA